MDIIGKKDFKDANAFLERIKGGTCAIVTTKNSRMLNTLIENFKKGESPRTELPDHRRRGGSGQP